MKKSSFFSKYIADLDTRIRGYAVSKSCFFWKCISELDTWIRGYVVRKSRLFLSLSLIGYADTRIRSEDVVFFL